MKTQFSFPLLQSLQLFIVDLITYLFTYLLTYYGRVTEVTFQPSLYFCSIVIVELSRAPSTAGSPSTLSKLPSPPGDLIPSNRPS